MKGSDKMERTITIVGKAELLVVPDQTTVTLQLKETDSVYIKALDKLQEITAEIAEGVRTCGISAADIKTTNYYASAEKSLSKIEEVSGSLSMLDIHAIKRCKSALRQIP